MKLITTKSLPLLLLVSKQFIPRTRTSKSVLLVLVLQLFIFCASVMSPVFAKEPEAKKPPSVYKEYLNKTKAIRQFFPKATHIQTKTVTLTDALKKTISARCYQSIKLETVSIDYAYQKDQFLGYSIQLDELGKHYPITFITKITPDFKISEIAIMIYRELYGSEVRKKRFLRQFYGKSSKDEMIIDQNITGISGATISAWSIARGSKLALILAEELVQHAEKEKG